MGGIPMIRAADWLLALLGDACEHTADWLRWIAALTRVTP